MLRRAFQRAVQTADSQLTATYAARAFASENKVNGVPVEVRCRSGVTANMRGLMDTAYNRPLQIL